MSLFPWLKRSRRLPSRLEFAVPTLRAVEALRGGATADAVCRVVIADCGISARDSQRRTRKDSRPFVVHEIQFALNLLGRARLVEFLDRQGWKITPDGARLLAEGVGDAEIIEILRAARRKKTVAAQEIVIGLRELAIPPKGRSDDPTPCVYGLQAISGATDVKIGKTTLGRIWERLDECDSGPVQLRITVIFEGGGTTEKLLHRRFAHLRRRSNREYFRAAPELALLMHAIPQTSDERRAA